MPTDEQVEAAPLRAEIERLRQALVRVLDVDTQHYAIGNTLHKRLGPSAEIAQEALDG